MITKELEALTGEKVSAAAQIVIVAGTRWFSRVDSASKDEWYELPSERYREGAGRG